MADNLYLSHILAIYGCVSNSGVFFFSVLALPTNLYPEALWLHKITCNWVKLNIEIFYYDMQIKTVIRQAHHWFIEFKYIKQNILSYI